LPYPLKIKNNENIHKRTKTQNYKHLFQIFVKPLHPF
jgi:hypothetical protein